MPELPEVETMVRGIRPHIEGREIVAVRRCRCARKPLLMSPGMRQLARRMTGATVSSVRRIAKRVVLDLSTGDSLAIEPRMTGLMLLADPPSKEHLRLRWDFNGEREFEHLWYWDRRGLGTVKLYSREQLEAALGPDRLGPDALDLSEEQWRKLCGRKKQAIKVALLDQKWIAGIGNLYASEILHAAKIAPTAIASELKPAQIRRLATSTATILNEAIRYEGSTLNDFTYRNALNRSGRYQSKHRVYGRAGEMCATCGKTEIVRIVQAQRSTFFCPVCQR